MSEALQNSRSKTSKPAEMSQSIFAAIGPSKLNSCKASEVAQQLRVLSAQRGSAGRLAGSAIVYNMSYIIYTLNPKP